MIEYKFNWEHRHVFDIRLVQNHNDTRPGTLAADEPLMSLSEYQIPVDVNLTIVPTYLQMGSGQCRKPVRLQEGGEDAGVELSTWRVSGPSSTVNQSGSLAGKADKAAPASSCFLHSHLCVQHYGRARSSTLCHNMADNALV